MKRENIGSGISRALHQRFPLSTEGVSYGVRGRVSSEVNSVVLRSTMLVRDFVDMNERSVWPHRTPEHEERER